MLMRSKRCNSATLPVTSCSAAVISPLRTASVEATCVSNSTESAQLSAICCAASRTSSESRCSTSACVSRVKLNTLTRVSTISNNVTGAAVDSSNCPRRLRAKRRNSSMRRFTRVCPPMTICSVRPMPHYSPGPRAAQGTAPPMAAHAGVCGCGHVHMLHSFPFGPPLAAVI